MWTASILLFLSALSCGGPRVTSVHDLETGNAPAKSVHDAETAYVIQTGDLLEIKFFYNPELNEAARVRPDGRISLQLIDDVQAAGLTPAELDEVLTRHYAHRLRLPDLSVLVREFASYKVYVGGEVGHPGVINLNRRLSCLQAIIEAGWAKNTAELGSVVVLRRTSSQDPEFITLDLREDLTSRSQKNDILLQPYDVIFVPKSTIATLNQFVDQYIDKLIPIQRMLGLTFFYNLRSSSGVSLE